jgi:hypothetical protein
VSGDLVGLRGSGAQTIFDATPGRDRRDHQPLPRVTASSRAIPVHPLSRSEQDNWIAKVDWDISAQHRASLRYTRSEGSEANFSRSRFGFDLSSRFYQQEIDYDSWTLQAFSDWTPKFSTELRATMPIMFRLRCRYAAAAGADKYRRRHGRFGTERFRHANQLMSTPEPGVPEGQLLHRQSLDRLRLDWTEEDYSNLFVESSLGTYTFDSIDAFRRQ